MARAACLACLISTVSDCSKKAESAALVAGTQQSLSNLYSLDISGLGILTEENGSVQMTSSLR
jgi:hypothetical protein